MSLVKLQDTGQHTKKKKVSLHTKNNWNFVFKKQVELNNKRNKN